MVYKTIRILKMHLIRHGINQLLTLKLFVLDKKNQTSHEFNNC